MVATNGGRQRSNTLLDRQEMATPSRGPQDRDRHNSTDNHHHHSNSNRRRTSVSVVNNPMTHLADELEIQDHQDAAEGGHSPEAHGPTRPGPGPTGSREGRFSSGNRHTPQSVHQHSAAAAMIYRHHRNLSDSSIDSQGGAFIDHRRQPHSLSLLTTPAQRVGGGQRSPEAYSSARSRGRHELDHGMDREDDEDLMGDFSAPGPGRAYNSRPQAQIRQSRSQSPPDNLASPIDPIATNFSSRTIRPEHVTASDLDENVIDDDPASQPPRLEHRHSQRDFLDRAEIHDRRHLSDGHDDHPDPHSADERSHHGSPIQDVCFPAHGGGPDADLLDINGLYGLPTAAQGPHGLPGVLNNFPFPFDFGALQEFAEREKEGLPIPGLRRRRTGGVPIEQVAKSPPEFGTSSATVPTRMGMGISSGSEGEGRFSNRQRKLSESVHPGRYRRKLALFEGAGDDAVVDSPVQIKPRDSTGGQFTTILDTKTPLLNGAGAPTGGYGAAGRGSGSGPAAGGARPYRFSFYSNALPSTIHARSLAEIPGEGQTFEELFVGRPSPDGDESYRSGGQESRPAFSPMGSAAPTHGANTPVPGASILNGARPAGIPTHLGVGQQRPANPRSGLIRSDVDAEANTWWLDVMCPTDSEMKVLSKVFGIHPLTTEDIQMEETREKIELFRNYYFVCFRSFEQDPYSPTYLEPLNMYIIVFREGTLSFHFRGTPHPQNVRRRIKQLKDYINVTSDWISYALIDDITDAFGPLIQNIEYEVDSIDELVLILKEAEQSDMLRRIGTCRKKVMGLLRLMGNKADVVKGLSKRCNENWSVAPKSDIGLYLSDIQDHITTSTQNLTHYEKILSRSHSNYLAQISIEMTDANNQINDVLSKLTALGTVLIPMNLVTGLWGMNVSVPGQGVDTLQWFFGIIGFLAAIAIGGAWLTYRVFVRN